jgi:branched-chain amino acid transport system permease protein
VKPLRPAPLLAGAALAAVLVAIPFAVSAYKLDVVIFAVIGALVVASYRFMTITGEWSLIHVVMMGVGGYASALIAKHAGLPFYLTIPLGAAVAGALAWLLSFPLFRMKGFYFLIGSFAAGEAIRLTWIRFADPFGGPKGLKLIPRAEIALPGLEEPISLADPVRFYFLALAVVGLCLWALWRLEKSRIGLTLHAIHWRDVLAESAGVDTRRYRTMAFVTASAMAAIAGGLLGHYVGALTPSRFALHYMLYVLVWVIVGGTRTFAGPIIGLVVLSVVDELSREFDQWRPLIYGAILIVTVQFLPQGLESLPQRLRGLRGGRRAAGRDAGA